MTHRGLFATPLLHRLLVVMTMAGAAGVASTPYALAQQPEPKAQPKAQETPSPAPAEQREQPQLLYAPWTKVCQTSPEPNPKHVCFTGKGGRLESGEPVV